MRAQIFYLFASLSCVFGLLAITRRNPIHSAIMLVCSLISLAVVYLVLGAAFLAMAQVFVYAGAIMVLFIFVIMLVGTQPNTISVRARAGYVWGVCIVAALAFFFKLALEIRRGGMITMRDLSVHELAASLIGTGGAYGEHALAFELGSVLVLLSIVGAIILTRKRS